VGEGGRRGGGGGVGWSERGGGVVRPQVRGANEVSSPEPLTLKQQYGRVVGNGRNRDELYRMLCEKTS